MRQVIESGQPLEDNCFKPETLERFQDAFMIPEIYKGEYVSYEDSDGGTYFSPSEYYIPEESHTDVVERFGRLIRLTAPGYIDSTDWELVGLSIDNDTAVNELLDSMGVD